MSLEPLDKREKPRGKAFSIVLLIVFTLFVVAAGALYILCEREKPQLTLQTEIARIGRTKDLSMAITDGQRGVKSVSVIFKQGEKSKQLFDVNYPKTGFVIPSGPEKVEENFQIDTHALGFEDGVAEMIVTVRDYSWWNWLEGNEAIFKFPVILDTRPPVISVLHSPRYVKPGSAGVVMYKLSEPVDDHGVFINGYFHPGFPLPKQGEGIYGATIGLSYDTDKLDQVYVTATDQAGNQGKAPFGMILRPARFIKDRINISDGFLNAKLPEFAVYYTGMTGTPVEQYIYVNNQVRKENYEKVREVCKKSQPERLWDGTFLRMARSSRQAGFGDHRTYFYQNQEIDKQVHLGIDLASVRHAEVHAANAGAVVFADYLGIYGNTVILDHGEGIFTLYSHMSNIGVTVNDKVEKGALVGLSGATGMAGGDHLHFSVLVNGIFVNPVEWWDEQWLKLHILSYL